MGQLVEQVRQVCALGALQTVLAIEHAVPILHAGPGCGQKLWGALGLENGCQGSGFIGGHTVPCTNVSEKEIIFGGEERLREIINHSLKILKAELFVVLTGCTAEIVGDDVGEVVSKYQAEQMPVIYAETGGFKGTNFIGHEAVLDAVIDQYLVHYAEKPPERGLVNVWSVVPFQDAFWAGNYQELAKLLLELGLKPNIIFGPGRGIRALQRVPSAQFNLLVSPWVGLTNMQHLADKFGTPYLHYPVLPIGPTETGRFLRAVGQYAAIEPARVEAVIQRHEAEYYYYLERSADVILETRMMPRRFTTISDSFYTLGVAHFLVNDIGLLPETQFITDGVSAEHQSSIKSQLDDLADGISAPVVFTNDGGLAHQQLRGVKYRSRPLMIGSSWERVLANELNGYQLSLSLPVSDRLVLNRSYIGYDGALRLLEDIYSLVLADFQ